MQTLTELKAEFQQRVDDKVKSLCPDTHTEIDYYYTHNSILLKLLDSSYANTPRRIEIEITLDDINNCTVEQLREVYKLDKI